jgi:maltose/moltooligosaccharide transporter
MIGLGGSIASALPWLMKNVFHIANVAERGSIPPNVRWSFYTGAFFFLSAVLYTVFTTKEYPPSLEDLGQPRKEKTDDRRNGVQEIFHALANMPQRMKAISLVQFFTWPGLFLLWFFYTTAVGVNIFGGKAESNDPVFAEGADWGSLTLAFYSVVTLCFAFILPFIADRLGRRLTHTLCLLCGALGLISVSWVTDKHMLFLSMTCVGIAWTSILSMPYAMLSGCLPKEKVGIYMGIFNFFIVLPEIIASLGFGWLMRNVLHNDRMMALKIGGVMMILAASLCFLLIREPKRVDEEETAKLEIDEQRSV